MTAEATTIIFSCSGCGRPFTVPRTFAGRKASCKSCGAKVIVPATIDAPSGQTVAAAPSAPVNGKPRMVPRAVPANVPASSAPAAPVIAAPPRVTGSDLAIPTSDPTQPTRRAPSIAVISEAQSHPVTAALAPATIDTPRERAPGRATPAAEIAERPQAPGQSTKVPVRVRRLIVDAEQMKKAFPPTSPIRVLAALGEPPELYRVEYRVKGLQRGWLGRPKKRDTHRVEIQLTSEYPRICPICRMLTPVFHPNIDQTTVCVGDHWTAGERLVDLVIRIGEMLAYQAYNIKSPLNGEAAMWADLNPTKLPVDPRNLHPGEIE